MKSEFMKNRLADYLWSFIKINNPELSQKLEESDGEDQYLDSKLDTIYSYYEQLKELGEEDDVIEELCITRLTADLKPSRFNYLICVLKDEFPGLYNSWHQNGRVSRETIALTWFCKPVFDLLGLDSESPAYDRTYYAVTKQIQIYMQDKPHQWPDYRPRIS